MLLTMLPCGQHGGHVCSLEYDSFSTSIVPLAADLGELFYRECDRGRRRYN